VELFNLTKKLISIETITGNEGVIVSFLKRYLSEIGFNVSFDEVSGNRYNMFAVADEPYIVFSSHLDTVAPYIPFSEDDAFLYGRGACDAKGIIAAMIKAAESLIGEGIQHIGLLFVVGEEKGSDGAKKANVLKNRCRYFINGEPTENRLAIGSKGAIRFEVQVSGKSAHSACQERGENAIEKLVDILQDFRRYSFPDHPLLGNTTVNIGTIGGGMLANVVPDRASAELMVRSVVDTATMKNIIEHIVDSRGEIRFHFECDPVLLESIKGLETTVVSYTTDIPLMTHWGKPFLLGPGSISDAHTPHERISKAQLREAVPLYCRLVKQLLAQKDSCP
jgi:acetylornithine deacetylase